MQAADDIALRAVSASENRDPMVPRKDVAARLREALPESPRLEFLTLLFGMVFVTVVGLLAIYFADRKNARHNAYTSTVWFARVRRIATRFLMHANALRPGGA